MKKSKIHTSIVLSRLSSTGSFYDSPKLTVSGFLKCITTMANGESEEALSSAKYKEY